MSFIGCAVMIPVNLIESRTPYTKTLSAFATMTPQYVSTQAIWSQVVCAWAFDIIIALFLWWNYKAVLTLRRRYFQSSDYQRSLHARTLMVGGNIGPSLSATHPLYFFYQRVRCFFDAARIC